MKVNPPGMRWFFRIFSIVMYFKFILILMATSNRHSEALEPYTVEGWIPGLRRDVADVQWKSFRESFLAMIGAMLGYVALGRWVRSWGTKKGPAGVPALPPSDLERNAATRKLLVYYCCANFGFLWYLHGPSVLFMVFILLLNYGLCVIRKLFPMRAFYLITWIGQFGILFLNEHFKGYKFTAISSSLSFLDDRSEGSLRWYIIFNLCTLRMISYNHDIVEADADHVQGDAIKSRAEKKHAGQCLECAVLGGPCYKLRAEVPRDLSEYNIINYFAYVLYIPLYIGGPISSFNAFISHAHTPQKAYDNRKVAMYALRILFTFLCLEVWLQIVHVNAIRERTDVFASLSPSEMSVVCFLTLMFLWLKFTVIWRFFRCVGLLDGVESPEDMNRCVNNNYTVSGFWRDWHSSFNWWIVRYMYIPLGGAKRKSLSIWPIFTFVALWHDIRAKLFAWAGVMCFFFVLEIVCQIFMAKPQLSFLKHKWYYRHLVAAGGTFNVFGLVMANVIGYGLGLGGVGKTLESFMTMNGATACFGGLVFFFTATQGMIDQRIDEANERRALRAQYGLPPPKGEE